MAPSPRVVLAWLFGEEGSVATESEVQVVMAATGTAITGIYLVSPIVSVLAGPFAVSEAAVGQLVTAFTAPSILLVPVFGVLADRVGRRPVLVAGLLAFGLGGGAIALTSSFEVALALRLLQGIGYAAVNPIGVAIIGDAYAGSREATAQGLRVVSIQAVGLLVPPLAGALVFFGWQYPFLLYLLSVPIAAWAWVSLPARSPGGAKALAAYGADLRSSLATPALSSVVLSFVARFTLSFSFVAYVSVLLSRLGASSVEVGAVVAVVGLVSLLVSTQAGRLTAAVDPARGLLVGFVAMAGGMAVMGVSTSVLPLAVGVLAYGVGGGISGPVQKSLVTRLSPPDVRAGAVSSAFVFQNVGAAGGPFIMGLSLAYVDVGTAFVAFGVAFGLAGVALSLVASLGAEGEPRPAA